MLVEQGGFAHLAQLQPRGQALAPHRALGRQRRSRSQSHLLLWALCAAAPTNVEIRFVEGRPVSGMTTRFLSWCSGKLYARGKKVWLLIWDNAPWHVSKEARCWIKEHNHKLKKGALEGVRIISCYLPTKSPWLNAMEPKWIHGKRKVVEADRLLDAHELAERVCAAFGCPHYEHLSITENAA